jgi:hypothetical protein
MAAPHWWQLFLRAPLLESRAMNGSVETVVWFYEIPNLIVAVVALSAVGLVVLLIWWDRPR